MINHNPGWDAEHGITDYLHNASDSDVKFASLDSKRGQLFGELTYGSGDIADLLRDATSPIGDGTIRTTGHFPCNARIDESWPVMPVHPPFPHVGKYPSLKLKLTQG